MAEHRKLTGYPSIDKPWLKFYTDSDINSAIPECTAYEYILNCNQDNLNKVALNYYGNHITYKEMFYCIDVCASALISYGVKRGDNVSVSLPNCPEVVYLFYALSKIGAVANMLDPRTGNDGIVNYINETTSEILFAVDVIEDKLINIKERTSLDTVVLVSPFNSLPPHIKLIASLKNKKKKYQQFITWKDFIKKSANASSIEIRGTSKDPVLIVHTGGTTGMPKGVVHSNYSVNSTASQSIYFPAEKSRVHVWLDIMPPFIAYGIGMGVHFPLAVGMEVALIPVFKPEEFDKLILKYRPNHINGVPSHWYYIINSKRLKNTDLSFLITCGVGGDSMDEVLETSVNNFLAEHNCKYKVTKGYGMTEVNGTFGRTTDANNPIGSVGIPLVHSNVKICDVDNGKELGYNEIGEIWITGPTVMTGYYNNPEETALIKIPDDNGVSWIKSGDMGYIDEDGNLFIKDRIKRIIVRHDGFKVFPITIENEITKINLVRQCCVVGVNDLNHNQGKLPYAFVVITINDANLYESIIADIDIHCRKALPEYAQPVKYKVLDELPYTPIGKIDYRALEKLAEKQANG